MRVEVEVLVVKLPPAVHVIADDEVPDVGINPRYLLQASNGRTLMDGDFPRHFQLIAFGYTFCPDICPTTLQEMTEVLKQLGEQAGRIQPLFISVDPERDTLEQLGSYVAFFDKRILGATGSPPWSSAPQKTSRCVTKRSANRVQTRKIMRSTTRRACICWRRAVNLSPVRLCLARGRGGRTHQGRAAAAATTRG